MSAQCAEKKAQQDLAEISLLLRLFVEHASWSKPISRVPTVEIEEHHGGPIKNSYVFTDRGVLARLQ